MSLIKTQHEADRLNRHGTTDPYHAANGHIMVAPLRFPKDEDGAERDYRVGDDLRADYWAAWCAGTCNHDTPPEDW